MSSLVTLDEPISVAVKVLEEERDETALSVRCGAFRLGRLRMPHAAARLYTDSYLLRVPRHVGVVGHLDDDWVIGDVFVVLREEIWFQIQEEMRALLQGANRAAAALANIHLVQVRLGIGEMSGEGMLVPIGRIARPLDRRRYPDSLQDEIVDMSANLFLQRNAHPEETVDERSQREVDEFLDSL